jgi:hypothetical protein
MLIKPLGMIAGGFKLIGCRRNTAARITIPTSTMHQCVVILAASSTCVHLRQRVLIDVDDHGQGGRDFAIS